MSPADILAQTRKAAGLPEQEEAPKLFSDSLSDDMEFILLTLEKRVQNGQGSLSLLEIEEFRTSANRVLADMKQQENDRLGSLPNQGVSQTAAAPPNIPVVELPPPVADVVEAVVQDVEIPEAPPVVEQVMTTPEPVVPEAPVEPETPPPPAAETVSQSSDIFEEDGREYFELANAAAALDADRVDALIAAGVHMDEATTDRAFWSVVNAVDRAEMEDKPLSGDIPRMLHHIYDADHRHLLTRDKHTTNVTCMQPRDDGIEGKARAMSYIFDDSAHKDLPLSEGRQCEGGTCCDACSRNIFPTFATDAEISLERFPELAGLTFNELEKVSAATILQFTRLIERVRRTMAHEYGLDLSTLLPLQAYSRKYVAGSTQQGGGGGEGDFVTLHTDEATHDGYHYSCVLYLSSHGEDFEGGAFVFNDPAKNKEEEAPKDPSMSLEEQMRRDGRKLTPIYPKRGNAVIFSSGWENMHEVETITEGTRYCVPAFFTTCPVPEAAYTQMSVGKPQSNEDIADDWLHLLLAHRKESPMESTGRVKELLMKWHYMCTPLDRH